MASKRLGQVVAAVGSVGALLGVGLVGAAAAAPSLARSYVALGDSYTSGPLILPVSPTAPADCLQSDANYPHLVAAADGLTLTDRSCSGATTSDMTTSQYADQGPQFASLSSSTGLVTIGIGGNDNGVFLDALLTCEGIDAFDPFNIGSPCEDAEGSTYTDDIDADAATVGAAFARIHALSPHAAVFVMGYPDILPQQGHCYPTLTLTSGDVTYLNGVEKTLDAMLRTEATANGATFVDTFTPSLGHDACKPESVRWVEPLIPSTDAFPAHPNSRGEAADAVDLETALRGAGLGS